MHKYRITYELFGTYYYYWVYASCIDKAREKAWDMFVDDINESVYQVY